MRVDDKFKPIPGTEFELKADLVLLAMGFVGPVHEGMLQVARRRARSRAATSRPTPTTTRPRSDKVFACGDMRRGQSLVVWAIREGRQCAHAVDKFLMGDDDAAALSDLPKQSERIEELSFYGRRHQHPRSDAGYCPCSSGLIFDRTICRAAFSQFAARCIGGRWLYGFPLHPMVRAWLVLFDLSSTA